MTHPAHWLPAGLNGGWIYRDRIGSADAGQMVSGFYAARYRHSGADLWRRRLAAGEIRCNGTPLRDERPLACGDRLAWHRPAWIEEAVPDLGAALFDDGDLLVLDKPPGLPVLPAGGWLEHTVLRRLEHRHQGDPQGVPRPVHRLGRFTSGLLVCARRPSTRAWLSAALRESTAAGAAGCRPGPPAPWATASGAAPDGSANPAAGGSSAGFRGSLLCKIYRAALVPGALPLQPGESLTITTPIGRRPHPKLGSVWSAALTDPKALAAVSELTLLERRPQADLVRVAIGSGRPHQIRIHCAALGAPLLGDPLYRVGGQADPGALPGDGGYQLQAWRLELLRPDGQRLDLELPRALGEGLPLNPG